MKYSEIVLIDDQAIANMMTKALLKQFNIAHEITEFTDASEALNYFSTDSNDSDKKRLIFLDINMPNMNGWEFLEKLSLFAKREFYKVIMLTSSISTSDRNKAKEFVLVSGFVSKPLTVESLGNSI